MGKFIDLTDRRFGRLRVVTLNPDKIGGRTAWQCLCDCGNSHTVISKCLLNGHSTSCGCVHRESISAIKYKHGGKGTYEYSTWKNIKDRCYNKNNPRYKDWGGRGIEVHHTWVNDFPQFLKDMGPKPAGATIERLDNDRGYGPDNCVWATYSQQALNKRNTVRINYKDQNMTLGQWAVFFKVTANTFRTWRVKLGLSMEEIEAKAIVLAPLGKDMRRRNKCSVSTATSSLSPTVTVSAP